MCAMQASSTSSPKRFSVPLWFSEKQAEVKIMLPRGIPVFSPDWRDQLQIPLQNPIAKCKSCYLALLFLPLSSSVAWGTFPWGSSSCKNRVVSSKPQTLENMGCAITGLLFKEASVLSIWQLFIIAVALRNNNSHDNCFSYIKMLQSLFPTTFCLSGMCVPMSPQP